MVIGCSKVYEYLMRTLMLGVVYATLNLIRRKQNEKQMVSQRGRILPRNRYNPINPMP
jgi:hypothetical protein